MYDAGPITISLEQPGSGVAPLVLTIGRQGSAGLTWIGHDKDTAMPRIQHQNATTEAASLREIRESWGITQPEVGPQDKVSKIENGHCMPGLALRRVITRNLNRAIQKAGGDVAYSVPQVVALCQAHQSKKGGR